MKYACSVILISLCLSAGCRKADDTIYRDKAFEEICQLAHEAGRPFCVVLTDSLQSLSREYADALGSRYSRLTGQAVYCIADVGNPSNGWYLKWLNPHTLPLTCVFSPEGDLVDLIPGAARETFLYAEEAIDGLSATGFHWPNSFKMNKPRVLPPLNGLLQYKRRLDRGIYLPADIDRVIDSLPYAYSVYLKLSGALLERDTAGARRAAQSLISLETPYIMDLYKNEFITAKKVLDADYDTGDDANIRVVEDTIRLNDRTTGTGTPIELPVFNDGLAPLVISKIHTSCSCLEQSNPAGGIVIGPRGSTILKFIFTPDVEGEIRRDIYIASNAVNTPIRHIVITARSIPARNINP